MLDFNYESAERLTNKNIQLADLTVLGNNNIRIGDESVLKIVLKTGKKVIINEAIAGGINGLINGIIVAVIALFWNKNPMLGLIIGSAMIINLIIAGLFGSTVPLIMKKFGKDPATSATIFITTATDVLGFFVFLGLASILL